MSRSSVHEFSTWERLSSISESEILEISKNTKLDSSVESQRNANSLIHTVTVACRSLPYCDEAAKEARAKLFSMWYSFGPPSVFLPFPLVMSVASGSSFLQTIKWCYCHK
jgi:hypothetical protein